MRIVPVVLVLVACIAPAATALPTPGLFCDASDATLGRVFPEPDRTNDFVSYEEARCGLELLMAEAPDRLRIDVVGQSVGWDALAGGHDSFDVLVARLSDHASAVPAGDKIRLVFQLSIHGNEKGGREGGLRVIEDLVRGIGYAAEHPEMVERLETMELLFVFPNPDGWTHEELAYRANDACYTSETCKLGLSAPGAPGLERQNYVRYNGHGVDVNREWPTAGWVRESHTPMSEPEAIALVDYLERETNVRYASDLHGMLMPSDGDAPLGGCANALLFDPTGFDPTCFQNAHQAAPGHFVLTMLPAGRQDVREMTLTTTLAELVKERLNADPAFAEWTSVPAAQGWWGGEFNDWGTVWDTLGYTDSGFTSDYYAQDHGLNAPGVDFEFSYNHVYFDSYYPGLAQKLNAYHVAATRAIVLAFMDRAALDMDVAIDAGGTRTGYVASPVTLGSADLPVPEGWSASNAADDAFDIARRPYQASINDIFEDLRPFLTNGELARLADADARSLRGLDRVVVPGSAARGLDTQEVDALRAFAQAGGTLILTDEALQLLPALGLAKEGSVERNLTYAGHTNLVDHAHPLLKDVRGLARMTYEPVPLGFNLTAKDAPVWHVTRAGLAPGAAIVGVGGEGQGAAPHAEWVTLGEAKLGAGRVVFLGALLPDPVPGPDAFYGAESYATSATGNQILRNALGWSLTTRETPVTPAMLAARAHPTDEAAVPGVAAWGALFALGVLASLRRR